MSCSDQEGHPLYLTAELGEDQEFEAGELLYRRYSLEFVNAGQLLPSVFNFPRPSFTRAKYSKPEDVLHPDCCGGKVLEGYGILSCSATDLPTPFKSGDNRDFHFSPVHNPEECCYAHTEIRCAVNGVEVQQPSKLVKERFRVELALKMTMHTAATR